MIEESPEAADRTCATICATCAAEIWELWACSAAAILNEQAQNNAKRILENNVCTLRLIKLPDKQVASLINRQPHAIARVNTQWRESNSRIPATVMFSDLFEPL